MNKSRRILAPNTDKIQCFYEKFLIICNIKITNYDAAKTNFLKTAYV